VKNIGISKIVGEGFLLPARSEGGTHLLYLTHVPWFIMKRIPEQTQIPECVSCMLQRKLKSNNSCIVTVVILTWHYRHTSRNHRNKNNHWETYTKAV